MALFDNVYQDKATKGDGSFVNAAMNRKRNTTSTSLNAEGEARTQKIQSSKAMNLLPCLPKIMKSSRDNALFNSELDQGPKFNLANQKLKSGKSGKSDGDKPSAKTVASSPKVMKKVDKLEVFHK